MAEQTRRILKDFFNSEDILGSFMEWAESRGTTLYPAQEEAILELLAF